MNLESVGLSSMDPHKEKPFFIQQWKCGPLYCSHFSFCLKYLCPTRFECKNVSYNFSRCMKELNIPVLNLLFYSILTTSLKIIEGGLIQRWCVLSLPFIIFKGRWLFWRGKYLQHKHASWKWKHRKGNNLIQDRCIHKIIFVPTENDSIAIDWCSLWLKLLMWLSKIQSSKNPIFKGKC